MANQGPKPCDKLAQLDTQMQVINAGKYTAETKEEKEIEATAQEQPSDCS